MLLCLKYLKMFGDFGLIVEVVDDIIWKWWLLREGRVVVVVIFLIMEDVFIGWLCGCVFVIFC